MIVPLSARPPRSAPSACASTCSTTASGTKREKRSWTWRRSASAFSRARATVSSASATWSASVSSAGRLLVRDAGRRLHCELAAPLAHHGEGNASRVPATPWPRRRDRLAFEREARARADPCKCDGRVDRGAMDLVVGGRGDEHGRRGAQARLAGERALVPGDDADESRAHEQHQHGCAGDAGALRLEGQHGRRGERRGGEQSEAQRRQLRHARRGQATPRASTGAAPRRRTAGRRGSSPHPRSRPSRGRHELSQ